MESYCYLAGRLDCLKRAETSACSLHAAGHLNGKKKQFDQLAAGVQSERCLIGIPWALPFSSANFWRSERRFEKCWMTGH